MEMIMLDTVQHSSAYLLMALFTWMPTLFIDLSNSSKLYAHHQFCNFLVVSI